MRLLTPWYDHETTHRSRTSAFAAVCHAQPLSALVSNTFVCRIYALIGRSLRSSAALEVVFRSFRAISRPLATLCRSVHHCEPPVGCAYGPLSPNKGPALVRFCGLATYRIIFFGTAGQPWSEEEHRLFLLGLQQLGKVGSHHEQFVWNTTAVHVWNTTAVQWRTCS